MRVVITGGTGLIGRALAASLAADKHEVIVLSRNPQYARSMPKGVKVESWDSDTAAGWGKLVDGADAVVNLAGESIAGNSLFAILFKRWSGGQKRRILESRVDAGSAVVQAIEQAKKKPGVLIQASAVGYYGTARQEELTEDAARGNDFQARVCWEWETSTAKVEMLGVRRAITRSGVVLSPKGGVLPVIMLPFKFFAGGRLGSGRQWFPWIHIADEVGAIRFLIENSNARGAFNLTAPQQVTNAQFAKALGRVMRRPSFFPTPAFLLRLALGEKKTIVLDGQRPIPKRLTDMGFKFQFPDVEAALRDCLRKGKG